jgi:predicted PurR-regulated permease PerM
VVKGSLKGDPLLTALAVCLLILSISALLYLGRQIFVPIALAILLSFVLAPAVRVLQSARFPHGIAVFFVVFATFALIGLLGFVVAGQLARLAAELPKYQTTITEKISRMKGEGAVPSTLSRALGLFSEVAAQLNATKGARDQHSESADQAPKSIPVVVENNVGVLSQAGGMFTGVLHPLGTTAIVLIFAIFVLAQREELRNRFIRLVGTEDLQQTTAVIDDATRRLSRFFLAQLAVNATYGLIIGIGLWLVGIPSAVLAAADPSTDFLEEAKSHAAKTAYVSSIVAPLMRVNDDETWDRAGGFMRFPSARKEPRARPARYERSRAQAMRHPGWRR